jgi:hypothetical protein
MALLTWKKIKAGVYHATSPWGLYTIDGNNAGRNRWTVTYPGDDYAMADALAEAKGWAEIDARQRSAKIGAHARIATARSAHARLKRPATNTTEGLRAYLAEHGFASRDTGAVRIGNETVFVKERTDADGNVEVTLSHPPKGGRAQTYHQRLGSRDRALKELRYLAELKAKAT